MRSRKPSVFLVFALALMALALAGCGSGNSTNITAIAISPTAITVALNTQADFTASVTLANSTISTNTAVTWQVNAVTGGNSTVGTIVSSTTDTNVGVYTAPEIVPTSNNGQVTITAIITVSSSSSSTSSTTITSNSATVTIGSGAGLAVTPTQTTVPAGGSFQFTATQNGVVDTNATWSVSSTNGGAIGSINLTTGLYTAPFAPPPGGTLTITATDGTETATATATIVYSDASLRGPFAFSYTGDDASGFRAVAGRFVSDGAGTIQSGVEDINSFGSLVASAVPMLPGSYKVRPDGRTTAIINTNRGSETWQFVLTSNQHALMIRFDTSTTGNGTIDQQNLDDLTNTNSDSVISGPYVFAAAGGDSQFNPLGIAGRFSADGAGNIPQTATIVDENDNGTVKTSDTTLSGSYSFDTLNSGTGRGTLTLSSTNIGQIQFAFYIIDGTHLDIVEIDQAGYLAGDVYSGPAGSSFGNSILSAANYVFTAGGNSSAGAYAEGGVFTPDANGNITGGALDSDNAGTPTANTSLGACSYTVDAATGRIDLKLCLSGANNLEFAVYPTAANTAVMLELDSTAVASGTAYLEQPSPAALSGNFALAFSGQGVFHNAPGSYQSNAEGQATLSGTGISAGNLDINNFASSPQPSDPIATATSTTPSSIVAPASNGRGTATIVTTDPPATYSLVYYVIDANTALLVGQDKTRVLTGIVIRQF
jgi:trimeric autotransporter adhesin